MSVIEELETQVKANPILLYMKGSPDAPQCGFSSKASQILIACGKPFSFVDILSNPEIRANLPDIIAEMHESGNLQELIDTVVIEEG